LIFDVVLRVFDSIGKERAKTGATGEDNLGGSNFNPPSHTRKAVPPAFQEKLKTLFNNPKFAAALKLPARIVGVLPRQRPASS
tara:strand:+ start:519 stop:767 length:249 start_codon:yes stop_codon:yes gene_type:complete